MGLRSCLLLASEELTPLHVDGLGDQLASLRFGQLLSCAVAPILFPFLGGCKN